MDDDITLYGLVLILLFNVALAFLFVFSFGTLAFVSFRVFNIVLAYTRKKKKSQNLFHFHEFFNMFFNK